MPEDDKFDGAMLDAKLDGLTNSLNAEAATMQELTDRIATLKRELEGTKAERDTYKQGGLSVIKDRDRLAGENKRLWDVLSELYECAAPFAFYYTAVKEYGYRPVSKMGNQALTGYAFEFIAEAFDKVGKVFANRKEKS